MTAITTTEAVVFEQPGKLARSELALCAVGVDDLIVETEFSGISTGTERLLWEGRMPAFPGLAYPLVPGYESVGRVLHAGEHCHHRPGDRVFVPGAACYTGEVRGLFGATASHLIVADQRCRSVPTEQASDAVLLALAATAMHTLTHRSARADGASSVSLEHARINAPELIVGHGTLGRLLARLCIAVGAPAPRVWESNPARRHDQHGYEVMDMADDDRVDYRRVCDVSGACGSLFDDVIGRLTRGAEFTLAGFYSDAVSFAFAPAFLREISLSVAAEWLPRDLELVSTLIESGRLSLAGLVTHTEAARHAERAYQQAFNDTECLKMVLDWRPS